jgi:TetR/AcrR family transcriptional repressor of nem operon
MSAAADQIRYGGLESTSAGNFMKSADLMHGGFYGHFASRADLPAQALKNARWLMVRVDPQCGN